MMNEIIATNDDTLKMLDELFAKRDGEWWNKFYSDRKKPIPFFKNAPDEELISYCADDVFKIGKSLDIGCGNGRNSIYLAKQGFKAVGIDISEESLTWARELSAECENKPEFRCQSILEFEADDKSFDLIIDSGCFHHIKPHRREQYLGRILKYLKDDGYFLMTCFNTDGGADISDYDVYKDYSMHGGLGFSEYKIRTILEHYFEIQELRQMKESDDPNIFGKSFMWVILMTKKHS